MGRALGVLMAWAVLTSGAHSQPLPADKLPAKVGEAFKAKFPGVDKVEWKHKGKTYSAEFRVKGAEVTAKFDSQGKWLETESAIAQAAVPKQVLATIAKDYKGYKIVETQTVERAGDQPSLFEIHIENAEEVVRLQLRGDGTIVAKSTKRKKSP